MEIRTKRRGWRRAAGISLNVLSVVITVLAAAFLLPTAFGYERYVITGTSMTGTIDRGSVVFEEVVPVSDLRVGDIITYLPPSSAPVDEMVTHRIVRIKGDMFRTKGDAVPQVDPWKFRLEKSTQARVAFHVPHVGHLFVALADRETRIAVIGVPAGLVALFNLWKLALAVRERVQRRTLPALGTSA